MGAPFSPKLLSLDYGVGADRMGGAIKEHVLKRFRKKGVVLGLSGGIDSSVVAALAVRTLGADRVIGFFMPGKDSSSDTLSLSQLIANHLGIKTVHVDLSGILDAVGCYRERDAAIK